MIVSKEVRYAMIRRAALKIQKHSKVVKIVKSNKRLADEVVGLDRQDYKSNVRWKDEERYVDTHFSDVYKANQNEEWN
jgi:hypothetical protein|tara:strand:- start:411 stop:644 length:234 start_codon:yes stop_codon:yes gene_type:complete